MHKKDAIAARELKEATEIARAKAEAQGTFDHRWNRPSERVPDGTVIDNGASHSVLPMDPPHQPAAGSGPASSAASGSGWDQVMLVPRPAAAGRPLATRSASPSPGKGKGKDAGKSAAMTAHLQPSEQDQAHRDATINVLQLQHPEPTRDTYSWAKDPKTEVSTAYNEWSRAREMRIKEAQSERLQCRSQCHQGHVRMDGSTDDRMCPVL